jgi:hypothetical protein
MERYRLLDPPHKGLRYALAQWALASGNTDQRSETEVAEFQAMTTLVASLLEDHARNEEEWVFPLLTARIPDGAAGLHAEHEHLDASFGAVVAAIGEIHQGTTDDAMHAIHMAVTSFQAQYLLHMIEEETTLEPALWDLYTDDELRAAEAAVAQSIDPELLLAWFRVCAPARTIREDVDVLTNIRGVLPPEAFQVILSTLEDSMTPPRFAAVVQRLSQ